MTIAARDQRRPPKTGGVREQLYLVDGKKSFNNIRDITERRHVEEGVRKSNEELSAWCRAAVARQRDAAINRLVTAQACTTRKRPCWVIAIVSGELGALASGCVARLPAGTSS